MILMVPCIFFYAFAISAKDSDNDVDEVVAEKEEYNYIAIGISLIAPLSITLKNYYMRSDYRMGYKVRELAIDQMFFQGIFQTLLYIVYLSLDSNNFQWNILFEGSLTAIFYALSIQCLLMACETAA